MKKKIILILIAVILCLISLSVVDIFNFKDYEIKKISYKETTNQIENSISNDNIDIAEITLDTTTDDNSISQEDNIEIADTSSTNVDTNESNKTVISKKKENTNQLQTSTQKPIINGTTTTVQPTNTQSATTIHSQKPNVNEETKEKGEKYVRNDVMINKIKKVIENNVTNDMKTYGYNIVVDPSIKTLTNQFTYTESRVINNIKYSFGTIRIYAEDYYSNGQLIMTECYIF